MRTMVVSAALSSRTTKRSGAIASSSVRQSRRAWAIAASSRSTARKAFFFARQPQAAECSADRPGMDAGIGLVRKFVPVLRRGPMIVALDQALESSLQRTAERWSRAAAHRLGAITALLAPLLEPQVDAGAPDPEALGHAAGPFALIARRKRTAARVSGIRPGHGASTRKLPFLTVQTFMRSALAPPTFNFGSEQE